MKADQYTGQPFFKLYKITFKSCVLAFDVKTIKIDDAIYKISMSSFNSFIS